MKQKNHIFLDIDGVLNNDKWAKTLRTLYSGNGYGGGFLTDIPKWQDVKWDWYNVANFKHLLNQTHAKVVISSSWRRFHTLKDFHAMFILYGLPPKRIVGETTLKTLPGWLRGDAVNKYVYDNDITNYVILDDNDDFYPGQPLIQTDYKYGLSENDVEKAIQKIKIRHV